MPEMSPRKGTVQMTAQPDPNKPGEDMVHYPKEDATVVLPPDKQTFVFNFYAGGRVTLCYVFYSNHTVLGVGKATRHPKDTHDWQTAKRIAAKRACEAMSEIAGENKEQRRHYNQELYSAFRSQLRGKEKPPQMQHGPLKIDASQWMPGPLGHTADAVRYVQARLDKDDRILKHLNPEYFNLHFKPEWATNPNIKMDEYSKIDEKRRATEKALEELYQMKWDPTPADAQPNQIGFLFQLMRQKDSVIDDLQARLNSATAMIKDLREFHEKAMAQVEESTENVARSNRLLAEASKQLDDMTKVIEYYKTMDQVNKERIEALENELANYGTDDE